MTIQDNKVLKLEDLKKNTKNTNEKIDKKKDKREIHKKIIEDKKLDYRLKLDKRYLKDELKLIEINKDNEFTVNEAKTKNQQDILILKAGKKIAKMCLILTFISCLMTIGGNIDVFICNIPLLKDEKPEDFIFVWTKILETKELSNLVSQDLVQHLRFNIITSAIYIPFVIALQTILYQVSINLYNIKTKFSKYYLHAVVLQYSMLIYSVYSNYKFLSYYTRPSDYLGMFSTFIPALLLDIGCIFFLSLSQDNKSLNYHENSNLKSEKIPINFKLKKCLKNEDNKNAVDLEGVSQGNKKEDIKKVVNAKESISKFTTKKVTGNSSNKVKDADIKRVKNYIKKLVEKGVEKVKVGDLKAKCKIDKNRWLEVREILVEEGILYLSENRKNTFIKKGGVN